MIILLRRANSALEAALPALGSPRRVAYEDSTELGGVTAMSDDAQTADEAAVKEKAPRPWYRKKRFWILGAIALIVIISAAASNPKPAKSSNASGSTTTTRPSITTTTPTTAAQTTTSTPSTFATTTTTTNSAPSLTQQQQSAVQSANQYLSTEAFSRLGLIDQLDSSFGSGYSVGDATIAVDSLSVNWNAEAVQAAKQYLQTQPFSCANLINQLDSSFGSKFTVAQATYGATKAGDC